MIKALLRSVLTISFAAVLVGGATFASWNVEKTIGNTLSTSSLQVEIKRDNGDGSPGPMFYTKNSEGVVAGGTISGNNATGLWYPGKSVTRKMIVTNKNTEMSVKVAKMTFTLKGLERNSNPDAYDEYINKMKFKVYNSYNNLLAEGTLADFMAGKPLDPSFSIIIAPKEGLEVLQVTATLDETANDHTQGISPIIDFTVTVNQV